MEERITYGFTRDLNHVPTMWTESYSEAVEDAKIPYCDRKKRYIIERTEHFEVCGEVEPKSLAEPQKEET